MSDYRRYYQPGGTSFFTMVTCRRFDLFADERARTLPGDVMREVRNELPFETVAMVLLPEHLHTIWSLPSGDEDYSTRWKEIKTRFTNRWLAAGGREMPVTPSQRKRGNRGIWQRRFIEHLIRDLEDLENHIHYVHFNPVKHGHVERAWDWPASTFRRFVELGQYPWDWGSSEPDAIGSMDYELYDGDG